MKAEAKHDWTRFLDLFLERNRDRPTRLGVFVESGEAFDDYWIEDGMPLNGITVEPRDERTDVELMFADAGGTGETRMTHVVKDARSMKFELDLTGDKDSLEFSDSEGKHTVIRFEIEAP